MLYPKFPEPLYLHLSSYDDYSFRKSSMNKHLDVVKWLNDNVKGGIREIYTVLSK